MWKHEAPGVAGSHPTTRRKAVLGNEADTWGQSEEHKEPLSLMMPLSCWFKPFLKPAPSLNMTVAEARKSPLSFDPV